MSKFNFHAMMHAEKWDHRSPEYPGIGGSETAIVSISRSLGSRGHDVTCYAPIPDDCTDDGPVKWRPLEEANFNDSGIWYVCRAPMALDNFGPVEGQSVWLRCDDISYGFPPHNNALTPHRMGKLDWLLAMSPVHRKSLCEQYPFLDSSRVVVLGGGIDSARISQLEPEERDPYRLIWTSSPDRGLEVMIDIFQRAREFEPRLHLHIHYGWNNCDIAIACDPKHPTARLKSKIMAMDQTNVVWEGRTSKTELYKSYMQSNLWVYPTAFLETCCVAVMEAQAMGAIPITTPIWGLGHNTGHGRLIRGRNSDPLTQARYMMAILEFTSNPELCEKVREGMQTWALERYNWDKIVEGHESLARECA